MSIGLNSLASEADDVSGLRLSWASLPLLLPSPDRASEADESAATKSPARRRAKAGIAGRLTDRRIASAPVPPDPLVELDSPNVDALGDVDVWAAIARAERGGGRNYG